MIAVVKNGKLSLLPTNMEQYDGEKIPGDLGSWRQFSTDPNIILRYTYGLLSERSTTLYHTHPPIKAAIEQHTKYAIGDGLYFRSQPDWRILGMTETAAKEWGMQFQRLVHYAFVLLNFYEKQSIIFRTSKIQGDSLLMFDRKDPEDGMPFDLIDAGGDQIDYTVRKELEGNTQAVLGVECDKYLRKKGLYLVGSSSVMPFKNSDGYQNIVQFYDKKISRQIRGYSLAYSLISASKNNDRQWDAILNRAAIEATILGVEKSDNGDIAEQMRRLADDMKRTSTDPDGATTTTASAAMLNRGNIKDIGSGNLLSTQVNGDFEFLDMKTPSNNFDKLQNAYYELVGMGTDTPPECVKSIYSTSYTAHKGAFNDFIKSYMRERFGFIRIVVNPVILELAKFFIVSGLLPIPNDRFFIDPIIQVAAISGKFLGPVPGHINPFQEVNALEKAVKNAFQLRSDGAALYGNEYDNMIEEWQQQEERYNKQSLEEQSRQLEEQIKSDMENQNNNQNDNNDDNNNDNNDQNNNNGGQE